MLQPALRGSSTVLVPFLASDRYLRVPVLPALPRSHARPSASDIARLLVANKVRVRYWDEGPTESSRWQQEPPLLLLHGLGGFVESWAFNIGELARYRRVIAVDLPGFGRSALPAGGCTIDYFARFAHCFTHALDIERMDVVGFSLGGGIALKLAVDHPERVRRLVLSNSIALGTSGAFFMRLLTLPWFGEYLTGEPTLASTAEGMRRLVADPGVVTSAAVEIQHRYDARPHGKQAFLQALRSVSNLRGLQPQLKRSVQQRLAELRCPTLVVWGTEDPLLPFEPAVAAAVQRLRARVHLFEGCGHIPSFERPAEFNRLVDEFLRG